MNETKHVWTNLSELQVQFDIITSQDQDVFLGYSSQKGFFNILRQCFHDAHKKMPLDQIYSMATRQAAYDMKTIKATEVYFPLKMSTLRSLVFLTSNPKIKVFIQFFYLHKTQIQTDPPNHLSICTREQLNAQFNRRPLMLMRKDTLTFHNDLYYLRHARLIYFNNLRFDLCISQFKFCVF